MSQLAFAYKMMEENRSSLNEDRLDIKRSGVKCEDFTSLYIHSSDLASASVGTPSLSRSLSDHSGKNQTFIYFYLFLKSWEKIF